MLGVSSSLNKPANTCVYFALEQPDYQPNYELGVFIVVLEPISYIGCLVKFVPSH